MFSNVETEPYIMAWQQQKTIDPQQPTPTLTSWERTLSQTKWTLILICLVRAWKTGLLAKAPALMLSHHRTSLEATRKLILWSNELTQVTSAAKLAKERYSDSVLERETTTPCFLEDHETRNSPKKTQYPATNILSSRLAAQSALEYPTKLKLTEGLMCKQRSLVPLRYLNTIFTAFQCSSVGLLINWLR